MRIRASLLGLALLVGIGTCCTHQEVVRQRPSVLLEHIKKPEEELSLKCKDVDKVTMYDFAFYTCKADMDADLVKKLELIAAVKKYCREELGFNQTTNYQEYKNNVTEQAKIYHRLYVTPKTEVPQVWEGKYHDIDKDGKHEVEIEEPTIFRSTIDELADEEEFYKSQGYETHRRSYTSFGGGCNITPDFLNQLLEEQVDDIIHEDFHVTVDEKDLDKRIEESMAVLIGRAATIDFTERHFGPDSEEHERAKKRLKRRVKYSKEMMSGFTKLNELYKKDIPLEEKLRKKKEIIDGLAYKTDNADLWDSMPYVVHFMLVYEVYQKHSDVKDLIKILLNTPKDKDKAIEYLKKFI